jgi:pre-mRNA-splicing factor CWC22
VDPKYIENEEKYKAIKAEIIGEGSDEESGSEASEEEEEEVEGKSITFRLSTRVAD